MTITLLPATDALPRPEKAAALLQDRKILLVEDNAINRLMLSTMLLRHGALVSEAEDGEIALERLRRTAFDLVVMDVQLPYRDGPEVTRIIRDEISSTLPVIALSASTAPGEQERCLQAGMNDFISKTLDESGIVRAVSGWLERKPVVVCPPPAPAPGKALYDLSRLQSIGNGDTGFIAKMIRLFIREIPAAAGKIKTALAEGNGDVIRYTAHRIYPAAHNMGIGSLAAIIKQIEGIGAQTDNRAGLEALIGDMDQLIVAVVRQLERELDDL